MDIKRSRVAAQTHGDHCQARYDVRVLMVNARFLKSSKTAKGNHQLKIGTDSSLKKTCYYCDTPGLDLGPGHRSDAQQDTACVPCALCQHWSCSRCTLGTDRCLNCMTG